MDSRQSTLKSVGLSTDVEFPADGYPLKPFLLKKWVYAKRKTQAFVARKMNLTPEEFSRKLQAGEKFNQTEIRALVKLMGAKNAFNVIFFPTMEIKKMVWQEVFERHKNEEELNE